MASKVNYKPLILEKLQEFSDKCPEYSFGEVVHSIATQLSKRGTKVEKKGDFFSISDEELYTCICKAFKEESVEDEPINEENE